MQKVDRGKGVNKLHCPVECSSSLKIHQSCNGADLMAHLQGKIALCSARFIIFMCKRPGSNSRCQGTFPPFQTALSSCYALILFKNTPKHMEIALSGESSRWSIKYIWGDAKEATVASRNAFWEGIWWSGLSCHGSQCCKGSNCTHVCAWRGS